MKACVLAVLLVGLLLPASAQAINYVTSANGTVWQVNDAAAPAADTGSLWAATGTTASALGGIHVRVLGGTPPLRNGELVRGFGLRYDGGEDFRTTTAVPLGDVAISRDVHVEKSGDWARWVDTFKNMGRQARTIEVVFGGYVSSGDTPGNQAAVAATSSGDTTVGPADAWATFATPTAAATTPVSGPTNYGPIAAVFGSPAPFAGGLVGTSQVMLDPFSSPLPASGNGANKVGLREQLVLQPGETKSLVNFLAIGLSETQNLVGAPAIPAAGSQIAAVTAKAQELAATPDLSSLSTAQICAVSNFDVATLAIPGFDHADCASVSDPSLAPVPAAPARKTSSPYDVVGKTLAQLRADMESGATTSQEITRAYLDRIAAYDTGPWGLNAFIHVADDAMAQARKADEQRAAGGGGALLGVPISLKDLYDTEDQPTTGGFLGLEGYTPPADGFQVERLRAAGAVLIGKTNLDEMASGGFGGGSGFGTPWNGLQPSRTAMGSSGGSATSVAASFVPVSMGTQTGDSLYGPATAASLATIRATTGLTSTDGVIPLLLHGDSAGPIARSVADLATILDVTAGTNPRDPETAESDARRPADFASFLSEDALQGVRLGFDPAAFSNPDGETTSVALAEEQLDALRAAGAEIVEMPTPLPASDWTGGVDFVAWVVEGYDRWLADHPGTGFANGHELLTSPLHIPINSWVGWNGPVVTEEDEQTLVTARWGLGQLITDWMEASDVDAVVSPGRTSPLDDAGGVSNTMLNGYGSWNSNASSFSNLPSVNVPTGLDASGSPNGIQFTGRAWDDGKLLGYAYALEQAIGDGQVVSGAAPKLAYDPNAHPQPIEIEVPPVPITERPPTVAVPDAVVRLGKPSLRSKRLRLGAGRRARVAVACQGSLSCGIRVTLRAGGRTLASTARTVRAGGRATVVLRLSRKAYRTALRARRVRVILAPIGPSATGTVTKTLTPPRRGGR